MKSVVVEASTVAKSIEVAWDKAGKPEEFFIRVLQEHHAGFLGFRTQKAKIVLFFKNLKKADSLFPTVLKQKEYTSFFGNKNLKVPEEVNVIDNELNKGVSLGNQKKKQHNKSSKNTKVSVGNSIQQRNHQLNSRSHSVAPQDHKVISSAANFKNHDKIKNVAISNVSQSKENQRSVAKQVDVKKTSNIQMQKPLVSTKSIENKKIVAHAPAKDFTQNSLVDLVDKRDDVVTNIARVLKKVQSQKIITTVSKAGVPGVAPVVNQNVVKKTNDLGIVANKSTTAAPRVVLKLKRRPLTTENPGVSGITKSSKVDSVGIAPIVIEKIVNKKEE